jgi:hypothetical protein
MKNSVCNFFLACSALLLIASGCKKKEKGVCYCSYVSGDKKEFNLNALSRSQQIDSCYVLDGYAEGFGGECELK